ncbi:hypothetical protein ES703_00395 [subsurface metagenome]
MATGKTGASLSSLWINDTSYSVFQGITIYGVPTGVGTNRGIFPSANTTHNIFTDCTVEVQDGDFAFYETATITDNFFVQNQLLGAVPIHYQTAAVEDYYKTNNIIRDNEGYINSGEQRFASGRLTAGNANAICFAWHNPEAQDILIKKVVIEVTVAGGVGGSHLDVGIADDAAGTNRGTEFFDDLLLNTVQIDDSWVVGDGGTQTKWVFCQDLASGTDGWIVGQILDANAGSLVGRYYIEYVGR